MAILVSLWCGMALLNNRIAWRCYLYYYLCDVPRYKLWANGL